MTFPTPPAVDLPKWCYSGGVYLEPPLSQRESGWVAVPGQNYAEPPPYQWVNWLSYSTGEWVEYLAAYALPYVAAGKFDAGLELYNNQPAKFYNAANDKYTSIKSSPSQSAASVPLVLPPALPTTPLPMVSDASGTMSFSTISSSAVAGITNGSALTAGQVGEYTRTTQNKLMIVTSNPSSNIVATLFATITPGVYRCSFCSYFLNIFDVFKVTLCLSAIEPTGSVFPSDFLLSYNAITMQINSFDIGTSFYSTYTLTSGNVYFNTSVTKNLYIYGQVLAPAGGSGNVNAPTTLTIERIA